MRITVFNGSPRGRKSNTHVMVEEFSQGAREAGAEVEEIFLVEKDIKHCRGCFTCWIKTPGICVTRDDMGDLLARFLASDIVVLATPLYIFSVSGIMKDFLDRLLPIADPRLVEGEDGECRHHSRFEKMPKLVVISNSGFPGQHNFEALKVLVEKLARTSDTEVIAGIYRDGGEILRESHLLLQPLLWRYKGLLRKAGREVAGSLRLSQGTASALEKPIIPAEQYMRGANETFNKILARMKAQ
ncbi:MAG: flavodoxin family protein [Chloroflexi bacterium]|nr:flavodoxin family protein [Chloroflexota bacterium]